MESAKCYKPPSDKGAMWMAIRSCKRILYLFLIHCL